MATIFDRVKSITVDRLGVEPESVVPGSSFTEDLNADSLDLVELIMAFEEEFSQGEQQLEISDADAENITTVQQAVEFLKGKGISDE